MDIVQMCIRDSVCVAGADGAVRACGRAYARCEERWKVRMGIARNAGKIRGRCEIIDEIVLHTGESIAIEMCIRDRREFARDNKPLGTFELTGIAPAPRGVPQILSLIHI